MKIEYVFRPKGLAVSIEKVFESVIYGVKFCDDCIIQKSWVKAFRFWPYGILYNILYYSYRSYTHKHKVYHITGDVQYIACLMNPKNTILTIHDLVPLHNKNVPWYSRKLCYWLWYYFPLKRLHTITCISEATKQDILRFFPWSEKKLVVVNNPVDSSFVYTPKEINLENPRILHIGTKDNKNLFRVIAALEGHACHLRIVGKLNQKHKEALKKSSIAYSNVWGISDEAIIQEYKEADFISFPSTFEGFGMPIVEGQAIGRPVVTSNIEPMLSVASDGAIIVDPFDIESIRQGFFKQNPNQIKTIIQSGVKNARIYSCEYVAKEYIKLYKYLCITY